MADFRRMWHLANLIDEYNDDHENLKDKETPYRIRKENALAMFIAGKHASDMTEAKRIYKMASSKAFSYIAPSDEYPKGRLAGDDIELMVTGEGLIFLYRVGGRRTGMWLAMVKYYSPFSIVISIIISFIALGISIAK